MSGYRKPFTYDEEKTILNYIILKNGYHQLRGYNFWKRLVKDEKLERSYQSLHERFRKHIVNNLHNPAYCLSREEQKKIKVIYEDTAQTKRKTKEQQDESHSETVLVQESNSEDSDETNISDEEKKKDKKLAPDFFKMSDLDSSDESIVYL